MSLGEPIGFGPKNSYLSIVFHEVGIGVSVMMGVFTLFFGNCVILYSIVNFVEY